MIPLQKPASSQPLDGRPQTIRVEPSPGALLIVLLIILSLWLVTKLLPVILVLVVGLIIVGTMSPAVRWFEKRGFNRGLGIAIVFTALLVVTVLIITLTIPSLIAQATSLFEQEPALRTRLANWLAGSRLTNPMATMLRSLDLSELITLIASDALEFSSRVITILAYLLSSVFLALYIMIERDRLRGGLFLVIPRTHHIRLSRAMLNLETIVGGYIRGQVITSALMAGFVFLLLRACTVPNALAIAVFAGIADVLPYIGAILSVGAVIATVISRSPAVFIVVLVLMLAYEEFESRVIIPRIYGRALRLPSSVILISLLAGGILFGIAGALLSLPVAAAVLMLIQELRFELPGQQKQAGDVVTRERDDSGEEEYIRRTDGMTAEQAAGIAVEISADRQMADHTAPLSSEIEDQPPPA